MIRGRKLIYYSKDISIKVVVAVIVSVIVVVAVIVSVIVVVAVIVSVIVVFLP